MTVTSFFYVLGDTPLIFSMPNLVMTPVCPTPLTENAPVLSDGSSLPSFMVYNSFTRTFNIQTLDPTVAGNYTIIITTYLDNILNILNPTFSILVEVKSAS